MLRFGRCLTLAAALAGAVLLGTATPARATFEVILTDVNLGTNLTIVDNDSNDSNGAAKTIQYNNSAFGNFNVNITARTNSPGGTISGLGVADRLQDVTITTTNIGSGSDTLKFQVISDGFNTPGVGGQTALLTNALASTAIDAGGSGTFTSSVTGISTFTTSAASLTDTDVLSDGSGPKLSDKSSLYFVLDKSPYTVSNVMSITLANGGSAQFTGTTTVTAPAPAGLVLALAGLPVLGLGYLRRRRAQVA